MKLKELERLLIKAGFKYIGCNKHAIWVREGIKVIVPTHREINRFTAKDILKIAKIAA